ncbi:hypothetical protein [Phenylobacterium sp.]|uniref:hypothetical protein n=1 Tax=Phenylobacterium sp. TaxID=1871053 RepID=UPI002DEFA0C8|nr:hypothetical protein [Phenylobacterium sp.]
MAFGQIDPARLQGDALTSWYLRSPADIEEERRQRAEQAYNAFFGQLGDTPSDAEFVGSQREQEPSNNSATTGKQVGDNRWSVELAPGGAHQNVGSNSDGSFQLAASSPPWAGPICEACHGSNIRPPPPALFTPRGSNGEQFPPSQGGSGSSGDHPKQCAMQYENDSAICRWGVPGKDARRRCWESAAEREAHCIKSEGQVGYPDLITW